MENILTQDIKKEFEEIGVDTSTKYFRNHWKRGNLKNIDYDYLDEINEYYLDNYGRKVDPVTHIAMLNVTGLKDVRIIPEKVFRKELLPFFNDRSMTNGYSDKNTYDTFFDTEQKAFPVIKRVRGQYLNNSGEMIKKDEVTEILLNDSKQYIIKPSDTNNGIDISKIIVEDKNLKINHSIVEIDSLENKFGYNFIIQRVIEQHDVMAKPHPSSVNTLRMVTLRWNNKINYIYTFTRFGVDNAVKDYSNNSLTVGVKDNGQFMNYGVVGNEKVFKHPTTNIKISEFGEVPNFEECKLLVKKLHKQLLHHNYVSWDIAVGKDGKPIFIEANFFGSGFTNQYVLNRPLFGYLTADLLNYVRENIAHQDKINLFSHKKKKKHKHTKQIRSLKKNLGNIKNENKNLEKEKSHLLNEINILNQQLSEMKNSKSWRYTSIFRKK